jgi:thioredoxin-related protein
MILSGLAATAAAPCIVSRPASAEAIRQDGGNYTQSWFLESFLELGSDLTEAAEKGKRFAIMWELNGCPYCRRVHLENFADAAIEKFIRERFEILQLNLQGSREVTDFDGEKITEKRMAGKYGIRYAPTLQFFPERADDLDKKQPMAREAARAEGYFEPQRFRRTFAFVAERAYQRQSLNDYLGTPAAAPTGSATQ